MKRSRWFLTLCLLISMPLRCTPNLSHACCPAYAALARFQIADQKILIAWDPKTKIEHFIREAGFKRPHRNAETGDSKTDNADFGFLVPSPSQPSIEATDDAAHDLFDRLNAHIRPRVEYVTTTRWQPIIALLAPFGLSSKIAAPNPTARPTNSVTVLESKTVAGLDVAVLKANDATALTDWLQENGYEVRPALREWVEPYIAKEWIITAFKIASQGEVTQAQSVRISFATDRPVFPYRVPSDQLAPEGQRNLLRAFLVGPGLAIGKLGEEDASKPWTAAQLKFAQPLSAPEFGGLLAGAIPFDASQVPQNMWLTAMDDPTWPSGTEDLWFDYHPEEPAYQEVRTVVTHDDRFIPIDLLMLGGIGLFVIWRRSRKS